MIEKLIFGDRQSGKTTELIKESARTGAYIVVSCRDEAHNVFRSAKELGLDILFPLTVTDIISEYPSSYILQKGILIDNLEEIISRLFNYITINAATVDCTALDVGVMDNFGSRMIQDLSELRINTPDDMDISEGEENHERDNDEARMY